MIITYGIIALFCIIFAVIILYVVNAYVLPKKIDDIAKMIELGQTKMAIKKLSEMLEKDDRNPYAHYLLAQAYLKEGNEQYAIVEMRQVLKMGRFDERIREVTVRSTLAKLYKERKSLEEAKKEYLILTKIDPSNFDNYYELGIIFFNMNVLEKASGFFKKAVSVNSQHDMSYFYLGQIHYRNGAYADAKQMFINTIKIDPANYKAHYFLGLVLRNQGDYEWAIKEFETAQKSDELKVKSLLAKGSCFLEKGQIPRAIQEFERGLKFAKKGSDVFLNLLYFLGDSQERIRDIQGAIKNWEKIVEINPKFRDVQDKLANYAEFRQDDRIKDFLIAGLAQFEHLCRRIVESTGLNILDVDIISDTEIEIIAMDSDGKWRNARQTNRIVRFIRTNDTIQERLLRELHEKMKTKNATRIVIITTGDFAQKAVEYANTRPVDLLGKPQLVEMLRKI